MNPPSTTLSFTYDAAADVLGVWLAPDDGTAVTHVVAPGVHADVDAAGRLVSVEVLDASGRYARAALEALASPAELLTLAEAAEESGLAPATLRGLLHRGRLPGVKRGRDWLVTAAALWSYLDSRAARGRKPGRTRPARTEPAHPATGRVIQQPKRPRRAAARGSRAAFDAVLDTVRAHGAPPVPGDELEDERDGPDPVAEGDAG